MSFAISFRRCRRGGALGVVLTGAALVVTALGAASEPPAPIPLPPPPELLDYLPYDPESGPPAARPASDNPADTRKALEPPARVASPTPLPPPPPPAQQQVMNVYRSDAPAPSGNIRQAAARSLQVSPPNAFMPPDYFNLPMDLDESGSAIPGVLMPELDDGFSEPGYDRLAEQAIREMGRPADPGMSIRQLEPYFALAKGSEATAVEARERGDERLYRDQLAKSIDAYMAIIDMADASTEAREESWYGIARCEYRLGNWWRSFDAIERSFPKTYEKSEVAGRIKLEMFIGERLWRLGDQPAPDATAGGEPLTGYQAASRVYAAAIFNQPSAEDAPLALLRRADASAMGGDWKEAAKLYRTVVEYYPESEYAMRARSSLAESVYRQEWPAGFPEAAREDLPRYMDDVERARENLSDDAEERRQRAVALANEELAENNLRQAKIYMTQLRTRKSRDAAVKLLGDIVSFYPTTPQAAEAADILRGMGIEPPMVLSDGTRFPIRGGWAGDVGGDASGGSVALEGQTDNGSGALPPSPSRETVYETPLGGVQ